MPDRILIVGVTGFVGRALAHGLRSDFVVRGIGRNREQLELLEGVETIEARDLEDVPWPEALRGVSTVLHAAAHVHVLNPRDRNEREFWRVNHEGTLRVAEAACRAGVRRFVFLSTIGVHGRTSESVELTESSPLRPASTYAESKLAAEWALDEISHATGMEVVIVRPPLVYGRGAPGNFARVGAAIRRGLPLPLGSVHNRRSFVAIENLVSALRVCLTHPDAAGETFVIADDEVVSTPDFVRGIGAALGRSARLLPVPVTLLAAAARALGKTEEVESLTGSLVVDSSRIRQRTGWKPAVTQQRALSLAFQKP